MSSLIEADNVHYQIYAKLQLILKLHTNNYKFRIVAVYLALFILVMLVTVAELMCEFLLHNYTQRG